MKDLEKIELLKEKIYEMSNEHCFIERERFLAARIDTDEKAFDRYALMLSDMLDAVSTPIDDNDIFVGRVVEAMPDGGSVCPSKKIFSKGHHIHNYEKLLKFGYRGILADIKENAKMLGTQSANEYAKNAETVIFAMRRFAQRYAKAAKKKGMMRAYEALMKVPYEPAYDLYSALQGIWLVHMISSCYVGSRDYAFGYMDEYLYPYYLVEKEQGSTDEDISAMLAGFFVKANEICGRHPHNYRQKPVLSHSSKQYVLLDGGRANEFSEVILDAAKINNMAQPQFTVVLMKNSPENFINKTFEAMAYLVDKLHVYNGDSVSEFLRSKGLDEDIVQRPAFSACCTADIYMHSCREEFYFNSVKIFCQTLFDNEFSSKEALLEAYSNAITEEVQKYVDDTHMPSRDWSRMAYVIDTLLLSHCNEVCDYPPYALKYRAKNIMLSGIATLGDSLYSLDTLVFNGNVKYSDFIDLLKSDFEGGEDILQRIKALPKFGNDLECDAYAKEMADTMLRALDNVKHAENEIIMPSFYSLQRENEWAEETPATPDGRRAGTPFSENQSPTYGADQNGITALLNSLARLPFKGTAAGGLNLTFSSKIKPEILKALVKTYFSMGGLHVGITVLDREVLKDAMKNPQKYRSLTVRMYGFSEYFITLPEWQQIAVLNRTAY